VVDSQPLRHDSRRDYVFEWFDFERGYGGADSAGAECEMM